MHSTSNATIILSELELLALSSKCRVFGVPSLCFFCHGDRMGVLLGVAWSPGFWLAVMGDVDVPLCSELAQGAPCLDPFNGVCALSESEAPCGGSCASRVGAWAAADFSLGISGVAVPAQAFGAADSSLGTLGRTSGITVEALAAADSLLQTLGMTAGIRVGGSGADFLLGTSGTTF